VNNRNIKKAAEELDKVFTDGNAGFTTMNHFAKQIKLLVDHILQNEYPTCPHSNVHSSADVNRWVCQDCGEHFMIVNMNDGESKFVLCEKN
jgi:transposase-like protein